MDAPKCKLCGERHWGSVCPKYSKRAGAAKIAVEARSAAPKPTKKGKKK